MLLANRPVQITLTIVPVTDNTSCLLVLPAVVSCFANTLVICIISLQADLTKRERTDQLLDLYISFILDLRTGLCPVITITELAGQSLLDLYLLSGD